MRRAGMATQAKKPRAAKTIAQATNRGLRLVVSGQGETRGRRPHLLRLRESLIQELNEVSDGQLYLRVEIAIRRLIDDLRTRPPGIEVLTSTQLEPGPKDEHLLDQRAAKAKKAAALAKKSTKSKVT
jgi:hypothetical protein